MALQRSPNTRCRRCNNFDAGYHHEKYPGKGSVEKDYPEISDGAYPTGGSLTLDFWFRALREECCYCQLLRQAIQDFHARFRLPLEDTQIQLSLTHHKPVSITATYFLYRYTFYLGAVDQDIPSGASLPVYAERHSSRSDTEQCYRFAIERLTTCIDTHDACRHNADVKVFPKRVLDVDRLRVIEDGEDTGRYACLSHCWGSTDVVKTTNDNLLDMLKSISWDDLTEVFKDAITVCRRLRTRYLWIDCLCIIQDSQQDWEIESAKMADYYENGDYTISAASSSSGDVPFLTARPVEWLPTYYDVSTTDGATHTFSARIDAAYTATTASHLAARGPLLDRGWAWQETFLSRRILYYTPTELLWECSQGICNEFGMQPKDPHSMVDGFKGLQRLIEAHSGSRPIDYTWRKVVEWYSPTKLTFAQDRLPALSGAASRFHLLVQSEYLAGLWRSSLLDDLCWFIAFFTPTNARHCPPAYIAPSWSWASSLGNVVYPQTYDQGMIATAVVEAACCTVPGLNPYGRVSAGYVELRGWMSEWLLKCQAPSDASSYQIESESFSIPMKPDCVLIAKNSTVVRAGTDDEELPFSCNVPCLFLRHGPNSGFIVVLQDVGNGEYSRIGCMWYFNGSHWPADAVERTIRII